MVFASVISVTLPEGHKLSNPGPMITPRDRFITGAGASKVATLQQIYRRIPAPAAKIERPGKGPVPAVPVQIERCLSLLVLKYSRTRTQPPIPAPGCAGVRESQNAGRDLTIPPSRGGNQDRTPQRHLLSGIAGCNVLKTGTKRGPMLQESLPGALDHRTKVEPGMSAARLYRSLEAPVIRGTQGSSGGGTGGMR